MSEGKMRSRKICVVTGSRAEYGIMSGLMKRLDADPRVDLQIVATNMHLSPEFGLTYREIEADGLTVSRKVEMLLSSDTPTGVAKSMGLGMIGLADVFAELRPELIVILGDRYEMLAVASAALVFGIPVAHLHGGEITEGAYDDSIRHAITKLAYLHFTSTDEYRRRVISLGEDPERVFCTGAPGIDNVLTTPLIPLEAVEERVGIKLADGEYIVATFHPVTRQPGEAEAQTAALLEALDGIIDSYKVIFTLPNSDNEGNAVATAIRRWTQLHPQRAAAVSSLGMKAYFTAVAHSAAVVGNSSSGLIEVPSFGKPTLNIGDRQKGRTRGNTVVDCQATVADISAGLSKVLSGDFRRYAAREGVNPYFRPDSVDRIFQILVNYPLSQFPTKPFYEPDK